MKGEFDLDFSNLININEQIGVSFENTVSPQQKECEELLQKLFKEEPVKPSNSTIRNIMFVGRTRAGKSTTFDVLRGPTYMPPILSLFSDTFDATIHSFTVEKTFSNKIEFEKFCEINKSKKDEFVVTEHDGKIKLHCNINIIDTPGLYEFKRIGQKSRDNESLKKTILTCMENEIAFINAIFFVCSFETGVNSQDVEAFLEFMKLFEGAVDSIAMIITRSESLDVNQRRNLVLQLMREPRMRPLLEKIKGRIFFIGALPKSDVENDLVTSVGFKLDNVQQMRSRLIENILLADGKYRLTGIGFVANYEKELIERMTNWLNLYNLNAQQFQQEQRNQLDKDFEKIEELKCFVQSEETRILYKKVIEGHMTHTIPQFKELFMKKYDQKQTLTEKQLKKMDKLRKTIDNNKPFLDKGSTVFKSFCELIEIEFKELCKEYEENPGDLNKINYLIEEIRERRYYLYTEESVNKYKKIIEELRSNKK